MRSPPQVFDRALLRQRLDRAAPRYGEADFLKRRAVDSVVDTLVELMRPFPTAVDLGARTGVFREVLTASPAAGLVETLIATDLSPRMLADGAGLRVVGDEERLPFRPASFDLVVSTLALHTANDLIGALVQIRRALKPGGLFLGAVYGGGTLFELRRALITAEEGRRGGAGLRVSPFVDPKDAPSLLMRAGLGSSTVMVDSIEVYHHDLSRLMQDLRRMGETALLVERTRRPLTRGLLADTERAYAEAFGKDGRLPATFELLLLTGWAPER